MNNKIFAVVKDKFVALRKKWGFKNKYDMAELAQKAGLPVEYWESCPAKLAGFLDSHDDPRFITVNRDLPAHEQAWFIARQIAFCAQRRRCNSSALDRPWKWEMFNAAPERLQQKISAMDIEHRAHRLMLLFSTGDEYRAFISANPKRLWSHTLSDNVVLYHLSMLRVKLWFSKFCREIVTVAFPVS